MQAIESEGEKFGDVRLLRGRCKGDKAGDGGCFVRGNFRLHFLFFRSLSFVCRSVELDLVKSRRRTLYRAITISIVIIIRKNDFC